jgi:hypothetical protein
VLKYTSLVGENSITQLFELFTDPEFTFKPKIANLLHAFSQTLVLKPKFFTPICRYDALVNMCLDGDQESVSLCAKCLINLSSVAVARVYIPGESHIAQQLRYRSFDLGICALMRYLMAKDEELNTYIEQKFFSLLEPEELDYCLKVATAA